MTMHVQHIPYLRLPLGSAAASTAFAVYEWCISPPVPRVSPRHTDQLALAAEVEPSVQRRPQSCMSTRRASVCLWPLWRDHGRGPLLLSPASRPAEWLGHIDGERERWHDGDGCSALGCAVRPGSIFTLDDGQVTGTALPGWSILRRFCQDLMAKET